jgi:hypothetical protein
MWDIGESRCETCKYIREVDVFEEEGRCGWWIKTPPWHPFQAMSKFGATVKLSDGKDCEVWEEE